MEIDQIIVLAILFASSFLGYWFFKGKFENIPAWPRYNLMFLSFGIVGSAIFTPFIYPYSFWKTLPVFTVIPVCSFNLFFVVNDFIVRNRIKKIIKEIVEIIALLLGAFIGMLLINLLNIGIFNEDDMAVILFTVFLFSIARILFNYARLEKVISKNREELKDSKIKEHEAKQQLEILYAKINPHFLYNSLNSIASLAMIDGKKTKDMTIALSKLLRYSLNYSGDNFATLDEEVEIIQAYFDVEKIRFGENLTYEINLSDEAKQYLIPRFLLQPIVENCFKHAFKESENNNFISVNIGIVENEILITIHDNGMPFPDRLIPGYGFRNVSDKLQLLLPGKHEFQVTNKPQKQVNIVIKELNNESSA
jgi:sensor histidine kinase YesM